MAQKTKVAVLGGGPAAVTAAFELTATPELRERYEVTLHTLGWRLGGKCASGRNQAHGQRIEEHGLHVWFGFYDNAFRLMQRAYADPDRPAGSPFASWRDAFEPCDDIVLAELWEGRWVLRAFNPPENDHVPGDAWEPEFWEVAEWALDAVRGIWRLVRDEQPEMVKQAAEDDDLIPDWLEDVWDDVTIELRRFERAGREHLLDLVHGLVVARLREGGAPPRIEDDEEPLLYRMLETFRDWLWRNVAERALDDARLRYVYYCVDFLAAMLHGILHDGLLEEGFDEVNDEEWSDWLARHGASPLTLTHAPFVRGYYDLAFAFEDGDTSRPNLAAGTATQVLIRLCCAYKGALLWKMQAGMGDIVFTPLYEVLRARGVHVEFFSQVTRLELSDDGRSVERVRIRPQARLKNGGYQPLVDVGGLSCWPSEPDWDQLVDGDALRAAGTDFERESTPSALPERVLRRGADFDEVVLAMSVGSLGAICAELAADERNPRFGEMLANSHTVATQAFQVWLDRPLREGLGWPHAQRAITSSFVEPIDTCCNMGHLLEREAWPPGTDVRDIAYFCGPLTELPGESKEAAGQRARQAAVGLLRDHVQALWPRSGPRGEFDWDLLSDSEGRSGEARFGAQYWRANVEGSERYVTTYAGTPGFRLRPDESGYHNLKLAGDWTKTGIDGGCVEAAVTSGMLAAEAICGEELGIAGTSGPVARRVET